MDYQTKRQVYVSSYRYNKYYNCFPTQSKHNYKNKERNYFSKQYKLRSFNWSAILNSTLYYIFRNGSLFPDFNFILFLCQMNFLLYFLEVEVCFWLQVSLQCTLNGPHPGRFVWERDGIVISSNTDSRWVYFYVILMLPACNWATAKRGPRLNNISHIGKLKVKLRWLFFFSKSTDWILDLNFVNILNPTIVRSKLLVPIVICSSLTVS